MTDATRSRVRCSYCLALPPERHARTCPHATPDCVAKLALAVSDAFEAHTKEPTPYNEGLLQGLQLAADIIGKNP